MTDFDFQCLVWVLVGLAFICVCLLVRVSGLSARLETLQDMVLRQPEGTPLYRLRNLEERVEALEPSELHDADGEF